MSPRSPARKRRAPAPLTLIVTEGEREKDFLQDFCGALRARVQIQCAGGGDARKALKVAVKVRQRKAIAGGVTCCFLVLDTESGDPEAKHEAFLKARAEAADKPVTLVASHPCFEAFLHLLLPDARPRGFASSALCFDALNAAWRRHDLHPSGYSKKHRDVHARVRDRVDLLLDTGPFPPDALNAPAGRSASDLPELLRFLRGDQSRYGA